MSPRSIAKSLEALEVLSAPATLADQLSGTPEMNDALSSVAQSMIHGSDFDRDHVTALLTIIGEEILSWWRSGALSTGESLTEAELDLLCTLMSTLAEG